MIYDASVCPQYRSSCIEREGVLDYTLAIFACDTVASAAIRGFPLSAGRTSFDEYAGSGRLKGRARTSRGKDVEQLFGGHLKRLRITECLPHVLEMFSGVRRHDGRLVRCDVERMQRRGDGLGRQRARAEWTERNLRAEQIASAGRVNHRTQKTRWRQHCSERSAASDA
jgi:hypothetical protein